jgi:hypothetical protein
MLEAGCSAEQLAQVVFAHEKEQFAEQEVQREKWRIQKQRQRGMSTDVHHCPPDIEGQTGTLKDLSSPLMVSPPHPPSIYIIPPSSLKPSSLNTSFDAFWRIYPRKIGKGAAVKAYAKAIKKAAPDVILKALQGYKWPDDREFIPHASTWLNGERWADETTSNAEPKVTKNRWGKGPHEMNPQELEEFLAEQRKAAQ